MQGSIDIDADKFSAFLRDLTRVTGKSQRQVIRAEAAKIIEKAMSGTKVARAERIRETNRPPPGGTRKWARVDGKLYRLANRYSDLMWDKLETSLKQTEKKLLSHRGISKKSFLVMAQAAGLEIATPSYVVKAEGFDLSTVTSATEDENGGQYVLSLRNDSRSNASSDALPAFKAAVTGRMKFFQNNLKKGVFDDIAATAKKYPGVFAQDR